MTTPTAPVRGVCRCGHPCAGHQDWQHPGDHLGDCSHPDCPCRSANDLVGAHASHCCAVHGCKYGDRDCPVADGRIPQDHACEICSLTDEQTFESLRYATTEQLRGELARRGET